MKVKIAVGLLLASLILLVIYGADVAAASTSPEARGFLPFDDAVRGGVFGGGPVVMSIIAFAIARKEYTPLVSMLLFVNGGLILAGMIAMIATQDALATADPVALRTVGFTSALGVILIGLGVWKLMVDRRLITMRRKEPTQK
jgi:hypothetical protein